MSNRLIAHLAHVEVLTPTPERSLAFYRDVIGLEESGRAGQSVYLRGWGEWSHHSVQLTEAPHPGLGHVGWRTWSPEDLERAVAKVEAAGAGEGWYEDADRPRPRLSLPRARAASVHELFWDDRALHAAGRDGVAVPGPPAALRPARHLPAHDRPRDGDDRRPGRRRGVVPRHARLDLHRVHGAADDADIPVFAMVTNNEKSHDLGLDPRPVRRPRPRPPLRLLGRLARRAPARRRHPAERRHARSSSGRAATAWASRTTSTSASRAACGSRSTPAATASTCPDWETKRWHPDQGSNTFYRNVAMPDSMMEGLATAPTSRADANPDAANPWAAASVH